MTVKVVMARCFLAGLLLALASCAHPPVTDKVVLVVGDTGGQFELQLTSPYIPDMDNSPAEILAKVGRSMQISTTQPFDFEIAVGGQTLFWPEVGQREAFYSSLFFVCPLGYDPGLDASRIAANCDVTHTFLHLTGPNSFNARQTFEAMELLLNAFESAGYEVIFDGGTRTGFDEFSRLIAGQIAKRATQYNSVGLIALQKGEIRVVVNTFVSNDADDFRPKLYFENPFLSERHSKLRSEAYREVYGWGVEE